MKRLVVRFMWAALILVIVGTSLAWVLLAKSLPQIEGKVSVGQLTANATIARDASGIPVITAENRRDLAYATGYAHAQDRFFQMDLTRRNAAGELSELFGALALPRDKQNRFHRFRARARAVLENVSTAGAEIMSAYADGVNAYLDGRSGTELSLEYGVLTLLNADYAPAPWTPVNSLTSQCTV